MARPKLMEIAPQPLERFEPLIRDEYPQMAELAERTRLLFQGRVIWHVSSSARGGGVAEMLRALLPYVRGVGIDTRWAVLREDREFFVITKRIHNNLHGDPGDGGPLGEAERRLYEETLKASAASVVTRPRQGDVVYLHDPQTAGLAPATKEACDRIVWRCHVGVDEPNDLARRAWDFLLPYVSLADACVFSREAYFWEGLDRSRCFVRPPSLDPFSPKNEELGMGTVEAILAEMGLVAGDDGVPAIFTRGDGTPGRIDRPAQIMQEEPLPVGAKLVVQVSRWDRLKDHLGVLHCFRDHLPDPNVHLALVGPADHGVSDDPEGEEAFEEVAAAWRELPEEKRRRAHLVSVPMVDLEENAAMVNAIQRRADVVVQKSIAEGFGMTVTEAMWKERAVVASRVGGIQDQIVEGESGILIDDPHDLVAFGTAIASLLTDRDRAALLGKAARERVLGHYLGIHNLRGYAELLSALVQTPAAAAPRPQR